MPIVPENGSRAPEGGGQPGGTALLPSAPTRWSASKPCPIEVIVIQVCVPTGRRVFVDCVTVMPMRAESPSTFKHVTSASKPMSVPTTRSEKCPFAGAPAAGVPTLLVATHCQRSVTGVGKSVLLTTVPAPCANQLPEAAAALPGMTSTEKADTIANKNQGVFFIATPLAPATTPGW